jgi:chitinase
MLWSVPAVSVGSAARAPAHAKRWVMGYYAIYQRALMPVNEIDWTAMTHLVVAAVVPNPDGTLDTSFYDDPTHGPKIAANLARQATRHGVVPILMVGGAGTHDGFAAAAKNHRARLVKNLLKVMHQERFAGIDLDWEPIDRSDQPSLLKLATSLRKAAPHAVLTMPAGWVTSTFPHVPAVYGRLAGILDRINVMTYGMAGAYSGWKTWHSSALHGAAPSTPSAVDLNVTSYERAGVPAPKLGVGIGFYGTCWTGGVTGPRQRIGTSSVAADDGAMSYTNIMSKYYAASAHHYDAVAQAPYLGFASPTGPHHCTYVSYEDPKSVAAKGKYAERRGLGSEIIWTINQAHVRGKSGAKGDPLLEAVRRAFH